MTLGFGGPELFLSLSLYWTCFDNRTITLHVRASFYNIPVGTKTWGTVLEKNRSKMMTPNL